MGPQGLVFYPRDWEVEVMPFSPSVPTDVVFSVCARFVLPSLSRCVILGERRAGLGDVRTGLWLHGAPSTSFLAVESVAVGGDWRTARGLCSLQACAPFPSLPAASEQASCEQQQLCVQEVQRLPALVSVLLREVCSAPGMLQEQKAQHPGPGQP